MKIAPPKKIYLQWYGSDPDITWCRDKISKDDVSYIQNDPVEITLQKVEEFHEYLATQKIKDISDEKIWKVFDLFTAWLEQEDSDE